MDKYQKQLFAIIETVDFGQNTKEVQFWATFILGWICAELPSRVPTFRKIGIAAEEFRKYRSKNHITEKACEVLIWATEIADLVESYKNVFNVTGKITL